MNLWPQKLSKISTMFLKKLVLRRGNNFYQVIKSRFSFKTILNSFHLFIGELEFSDQDNFDLNGPKEVRVPPPEGFADDLKLNENSHAAQLNIEPSSTHGFAEVVNPTSLTPNLPQFNPLANFSPEQVMAK